MAVELLIAPPACGKTEACLQQIREAKTSHPLAKTRVLVPDRQNAAYFRRRWAESGGGMGVAVGTFRDFFREILEKNGIFVPVITPALEHRLVQETVQAVYESGDLLHYGNIKHKPGFIQVLQDCFSELRSGYVSPDELLKYTNQARPARRELAVLYHHFLERLKNLNWIDQDGLIWLAISALQSNLQTLQDVHLVVVDGFSSFLGARRQFLKHVSEQCPQVLITLPGRLNSMRQVHRRTQVEIETLQRELSASVTELTGSAHFVPQIRHLEQYALEANSLLPLEPEHPLLIEVSSQAEEAREALRWIKGLHIRQNVAIGDCAIFASHLAGYQPLLRAAAGEFGIKVHFTHPDPLAESPAVLALLTLLSLPVEGYRTRPLLNTLRSPYFDFGMQASELEQLEKISRQACIVMGYDQWQDAWSLMAKSRSSSDEDLDDERQSGKFSKEIDLPSLWASFSKFWALFEAITETRSQTAWINWLEAMLGKLDFYAHISSERDQEACRALGEALKALIMSEEVAGMRTVDYEQFLTDLKGTLHGAVLEEDRESRKNAVFIGQMYEARATRYKAVALLGFSEGLFPAIENPDPFLDEEMRRDLGLEPRLQREQAGIFYQAFTRPDIYLLLTRPYLAEDGEAWQASPYWTSAKGLFTESSVLRISPNASRPQADAASPQELLFWAMQQNGLLYEADEDLSSRWQQLAQARRILAARRAKHARGAFEGHIEQVAHILTERYSPEHTWSASRLENYGTCPHYFFVSSVLELTPKEPPELGLDAAQLGSIYHRILELVYSQASTSDRSTSILDFLNEVAAEVFKKAPDDFGFRPSPLWEVEKVQFVETLRKTIEALQEKSVGWEPDRFEQKFGVFGKPPLLIHLGGECVQIRGVIDRVDRDTNGQIRVIDYKTGGSNLAAADLKNGRRLQLPIYALAAQDALKLGRVADGFYWKIGQAEASSFTLAKYETESEQGPAAAYQTAIAHIKDFLSGIRSGKFPPKPPSGGCPAYCPAAQWCWRFEAGY